MFRWIVVPIAVAACLLAGIVGAMTGICTELQWPLSEENLAYTIRWGVVAGLLGSFLAVGLLLSARRERLWWIAVVVMACTLLVSCVGIWWNVVTSLG